MCGAEIATTGGVLTLPMTTIAVDAKDGYNEHSVKLSPTHSAVIILGRIQIVSPTASKGSEPNEIMTRELSAHVHTASPADENVMRTSHVDTRLIIPPRLVGPLNMISTYAPSPTKAADTAEGGYSRSLGWLTRSVLPAR